MMRFGLFQWLRNSFIAGFFVTVPLVISVAALVWIFQVVDGFMAPVFGRVIGADVPGLGLLTTLLGVLLVGVIATNVLGRRIVQRGEEYLLRIPIFRAIYAPVKQLVVAFSPENESGFKRVVLVEQPNGALVLGFLTREFTIERGSGPELLIAIYVPTNHLYLGDVFIYPRGRVSYPDITVQEAIRIFLTGGMAMSPKVGTGVGPAEQAKELGTSIRRDAAP